MVVTHTVEGLINGRLTILYDLGNDVLYLRRVDYRDRRCFGEETDQGVVLRDAGTDEIAGLTAVG